MNTLHRYAYMSLMVVALGACKSNSPAARSDGQVDPELVFNVVSPEHLRTNYRADEPLIIHTYGSQKVSPAAWQAKLEAATTVVTWPAQAVVQGSWQHTFSTPYYESKFSFKNTVPEGDYVLRIMESGFTVLPRSKTLFRIGSLPRVIGVSISASNKSLSPVQYDLVRPRFSEAVNLPAIQGSLEVQAATGWQPLSYAAPLFTLSSGLDLTAPLRIRVKADVGAESGKLLDGTFQGTPGSDFEAVFVPKQYAESNQPWIPALSL